jgi:hypothetical protein
VEAVSTYMEFTSVYMEFTSVYMEPSSVLTPRFIGPRKDICHHDILY